MNYGIPYMGNKSKIIQKLCAVFPNADHFYDLFGGGFSVTHYMIKHRYGNFKEFHFNEIRPGMTKLIQDAINGEYSYDKFKPQWIFREDFLKNKENDLYTKLIWSFGNSGNNYLFGKDIEEYKRSLHQAIVFNEFNELATQTLGLKKFHDASSITDRRLFLRNRVAALNPGKNRGQLERLQQLERLEQLERLQQLERLEFHSTSFENVPIKPHSVIYCDIPYDGTAEYDGNASFNRNLFYEWAASQMEPLFISEYNIAHSHFRLLLEIKTTKSIERVYCNDIAYKILLNRKRNSSTTFKK